MSDNRIANRYAASLLQLAIEKGQLDAVYADMMLIGESIKQNRDLLTLFKSPVVKHDAKQKVVAAIFGDYLSQITSTFLNLVIRKRREDVVPAMTTSFARQYNLHKGIVEARLETAAEIDEALKSEILEIIKAETHKQVQLQLTVNPDLIAGFVLTVGDQRYEASVARELKDLKKLFSDNPYIQKY
ncbi:MAG: ATP synthase F1 subunit delta [Bacteroidia bacterium]|jgi:F-type H+-transporting ATPase subunit delta